MQELNEEFETGKAWDKLDNNNEFHLFYLKFRLKIKIFGGGFPLELS